MKQLLTHSRMQSFKSCRKRAHFEYEVGIRKEVDAKALRMGIAGHDALDVLKKGQTIEAAIQAVADHYHPCPEGMDEWEWSIEQETVETLVSGYHWRWGEQPLDVIASEQSFRLPLRNPDTNAHSKIWDAAGKIDGIIQEDGRKLVLEHKFISDPLDQDDDYWRRLQLDTQISVYVWAAHELNHDVQGVLYDVIRKPTIRPSQIPLLDDDGLKVVLDANGERVMTKQGKPRQTGDTKQGFELQQRRMTPEEWSDKLLKDIGERPEYYYARVEIARLDSDIEETLHEMWDVQKTIRDAQNQDRWYRTVNMNTCTYCPFFGLCSSRFDPSIGEAPEGFVLLDDVHPELNQ